MREIRFRAWDTIGKKMYHNVSIDNTGKPQSLDILNAGWTIQKEYPNLHEIMQAIDAGTNFIVMQFTGLRDQKGKERYHDDIIKRETGYIFIEKPRYFHLGPTGTAMAWGYDYHPGDEIIGNVWQNPELMEGA